jgi:hypothetical protein
MSRRAVDVVCAHCGKPFVDEGLNLGLEFMRGNLHVGDEIQCTACMRHTRITAIRSEIWIKTSLIK